MDDGSKNYCQRTLRSWNMLEDVIKVLRHSENFLILEKPFDMVINSNDPNKRSVQTEICRLLPGLANPKLRHDFHFVHRLDFATSGVMCIALTKKSAREASLAFTRRFTKKYYLALVHGHVAEEKMIIDKAVGEDPREKNGSRKMCTSEDVLCENARNCLTALLVLERGSRDGNPVTKVMLRPITGRRHQLRVHCNFIGHTIVGDYTYSERKDCEPHRTFLHALRLKIENNIETIDEKTNDPFLPEDPRNRWVPKEFLRKTEDAFREIDQLVIN